MFTFKNLKEISQKKLATLCLVVNFRFDTKNQSYQLEFFVIIKKFSIKIHI